jgi:predicted transport protein
MGNLHRWNLECHEVRSVGAYATGDTKIKIKNKKTLK